MKGDIFTNLDRFASAIVVFAVLCVGVTYLPRYPQIVETFRQFLAWYTGA